MKYNYLYYKNPSLEYYDIKQNIDNTGPLSKEHFQSGSIPPIPLKSEEKINKIITVSPLHNAFIPFYSSRLFKTFTYSPCLLAFLKNDNINTLSAIIKKEFYYLNMSQDKIDIDLCNEIDFNNFDKKTFYTISIDPKIKANINLINSVDNILINQFLYIIKEKIGGFLFICNVEHFESFSLHIYTYSDMIFIDYLTPYFKENIKLLSPISFIVDLDFSRNMICIDRTTNWIELKCIEYTQ